MKNKLLVMLAVGALLALCASAAVANVPDRAFERPVFPRLAAPEPAPSPSSDEFRGARAGTTWFFWANFEDPDNPHNQWRVLDRSGTMPEENYWHKDDIRITRVGISFLPDTTFAHLGDSTWWCGTYNDCYRQGRGYGNDWIQILERSFPLGAAWADSGDYIKLEWDQRFAIEANWDYGYVEVQAYGDTSWVELAKYHNTAPQTTNPGFHKDWDNATYGHVAHDLSGYWSSDTLRIRYRFDSDQGLSSADFLDNPPKHSVLDGAWQLDNWKLSVFDPESTLVWSDDCEAAGDNGWIHDDIAGAGQCGTTWWRAYMPDQIETWDEYGCESRTGWMMAAVDPFSKRMVNDENAWMNTPTVDISGLTSIIAKWNNWIDLPDKTNDFIDWYVAAHDTADCCQDLEKFEGTDAYYYYGGPFWDVNVEDETKYAQKNYMSFGFRLYDLEPSTAVPEHQAGYILNRFRLGYLEGDPGTQWLYDRGWGMIPTWFIDDVESGDAAADTALVVLQDQDGIKEAYLMAWDDTLNGGSWDSYPLLPVSPGDPENIDYYVPPPVRQHDNCTDTTGVNVYYYFTATDSADNVSVHPADAPDRVYVQRILPVKATERNPGILLVDKMGNDRGIPGETRYQGIYHNALYYYREMLGILGYEWDEYQPLLPSSSVPISNGPDTAGMKYYDTQIYFANIFEQASLNERDQYCLIQWLQECQLDTLPFTDRNLLLTGNDIGKWLKPGDPAAHETLNFYSVWMASDFQGDRHGAWDPDSIPGLVNYAGGTEFMTYLDGACILAGACPTPMDYDKVAPKAGTPGNELVAEYDLQAPSANVPAGCAYTDQTLLYQTVNLGFAIEQMMDSKLPNGYYKTGINDRVDLMDNIMTYFGKTPTGVGTDVPVGEFKNMLTHAYPNPFNPVTTISYSVKETGPVSIRVYNVAGKVVRTLLDKELDAGAEGKVVWDGTNDVGSKCASGVYFYRIEAPGFRAGRKMVMLK